jgi:4-hydroxyphenylpyruvate dioxygenase
VVDLAFLVSDLETIAHHSNCVLQSHRGLKYCELVTPVQFKHTLIEGFGSNPVNPLTGLKLDYVTKVSPPWFTHIDHLVLNVEGGKLEMMVNWYEKVLGFERQQSFQIGTPFSALSSQVLIHPKTGIQLPINEPVDINSQIHEFIELNRGSGIQHIALSTPNITRTCARLSTAGLSFLTIPKSYYDHLPDLNISPQEYIQLQTQGILAEIQAAREGNISPVLLQIFTNPIFTTPTFFFELIERRHNAQGFGAGNFQALFEAIEREQLKRRLQLS